MRKFKITIDFSEDHEVAHDSRLEAENRANTMAAALAADKKRVTRIRVVEVQE